MLERLSFVTPYLPWLALASIASLILAIALLPTIVLRLPSNYFIRERRSPVRRESEHRLPLTFANIVKNLIGVVFILAGILMLFIPGQGLLTMLIGLILTNFPGKYRLEQKMIRQPKIAQTLNGLRARAGKEHFELPNETDD